MPIKVALNPLAGHKNDAFACDSSGSLLEAQEYG
jgi:hypothetical protein